MDTADRGRRVLRVALAAEESAGSLVLELLLARGHEVVVVVSGSKDSGAGASVAERARLQGLAVRPPSDMRSDGFAAWLTEQQVDLLLNVHSLVIASAGVIEAPRHGSYNLHPGPLPQYAGLNVPSWALLRGEQRHGVSLHRMTATVDAGPVAFSSEFVVNERDTALTVYLSCIRDGRRLIEQLLDVLEQGLPVPEQAQDPSQRRWFPAGPPDDGRSLWDRTARDLIAFVRACDYGPFASPWGHPRCSLPDGPMEVLRASMTGRPADAPAGTVGNASRVGVLVAAQDEWVLVEQVTLDGRRVDAAKVLVRGTRLVPDVLSA